MMRAMRISSLALLCALACSSNPKPDPKTPETTAEPSAGGAETAESEGAAAGEGGETAGSEGEGEGGEEGGEKPAGEGGGEETRSTQSIAKTISANRKPIRACYDKARKDLPELKGTMTIHFVLDPEGNVKKAELNVERSDIKSPDVVNCAIGHLKKLKFPPSSKGMDTTVNYPFDFKPDGGG